MEKERRRGPSSNSEAWFERLEPSHASCHSGLCRQLAECLDTSRRPQATVFLYCALWNPQASPE